MGFIFALILAMGTWFGGWVYAHKTIADECERLNAFYVGGRVFECNLSEKKSQL